MDELAKSVSDASYNIDESKAEGSGRMGWKAPTGIEPVEADSRSISGFGERLVELKEAFAGASWGDGGR